jgi:hypothetical protein
MFQTNLAIKRGCPPHLTCVNAQPWKTGNFKIHDLGDILVSICRYKSTFAIICQVLILLAITRSSFIQLANGQQLCRPLQYLYACSKKNRHSGPVAGFKLDPTMAVANLDLIKF